MAIFDSLRVNQLSEAGLCWYATYMEAIHKRDVESLSALIDEDAWFQINNHLPAYGKRAIVAATQRDWQGSRSLQLEALTILGSDREFAVEALCHYTRLSGDVFTIPTCSFKTRNANGLLTSVRIFADLSPLFQ